MGAYDEKRRSPRIQMFNRLRGHVASLEMPVVVREISLGGMSLQTPEALEVGSVLEFRLTLGDGSEVPLRGRVLRSARVPVDSDPPSFVSGIQFVRDADESVGDILGSFS